jgi:very-short-patch-repair endonuclease
MRSRQLTCGEPANFQGDERDVIIISTVVATDPAIPSSRIAAMTGTPAMRRINVAASRARNQMWVVHSADAERFADGDLRGALIRHCREAGSAGATAADLLDVCESQFERDVVQRIVAHGYRKVSVQHRVGRFRIDIVIEGPYSRLAVECDGDRWHGPDVWHQDRARQQVLERANWTFERIRGSAFYRDPDAALAPLWERLTELSIPKGDWSADVTHPVIREVSGCGRVPVPQEAEDLTTAGDHQPEAGATLVPAAPVTLGG